MACWGTTFCTRRSSGRHETRSRSGANCGCACSWWSGHRTGASPSPQAATYLCSVAAKDQHAQCGACPFHLTSATVEEPPFGLGANTTTSTAAGEGLRARRRYPLRKAGAPSRTHSQSEGAPITGVGAKVIVVAKVPGVTLTPLPAATASSGAAVALTSRGVLGVCPSVSIPVRLLELPWKAS